MNVKKMDEHTTDQMISRVYRIPREAVLQLQSLVEMEGMSESKLLSDLVLDFMRHELPGLQPVGGSRPRGERIAYSLFLPADLDKKMGDAARKAGITRGVLVRNALYRGMHYPYRER